MSDVSDVWDAFAALLQVQAEASLAKAPGTDMSTETGVPDDWVCDNGHESSWDIGGAKEEFGESGSLRSFL